MPAYKGIIPEEGRWRLVNYIRTMSQKPLP
ncbi:MAG: cytochrome c [Chloroflexi bacterium]|nr:cytochrome c [Chloroflexota bacterium]